MQVGIVIEGDRIDVMLTLEVDKQQSDHVILHESRHPYIEKKPFDSMDITQKYSVISKAKIFAKIPQRWVCASST